MTTHEGQTPQETEQQVNDLFDDQCFLGAELCVPAMPFTAFVADKLEPLSETRSFNRLDIGAPDRGERGDVLSVAPGVRRAEERAGEAPEGP
jgi:hypothetical protein